MTFVGWMFGKWSKVMAGKMDNAPSERLRDSHHILWGFRSVMDTLGQQPTQPTRSLFLYLKSISFDKSRQSGHSLLEGWDTSVLGCSPVTWMRPGRDYDL